jgi:hypothetical protein
MNSWFEVDKEGLAKIAPRRGKVFVLHELLQNAWDCDGTKRVTVSLTNVPNRPLARLVVEDDHPTGFSNLSHAYTLFAESEKKGDTRKRGRFNLGEKLVLSLCESAEIESTKGTVIFDEAGRRQTRSRRKAGTEFRALLRMTREELAEALEQTRFVIPPDSVETILNGQQISARKPDLTYHAVLQTEAADANGMLRRKYHETQVHIYSPRTGETAMLYEMGIPVMDLGDDPFHVNVMQKIPLSMERDAVTPYWLREMRGTVLDKAHQLLSQPEACGKWASDALEVSDNQQAVRTIITQRFGDKVVIADPSDREGENIAKAAGYTVIPGGSFTADAWDKIHEANAALPAGRVTPSPKPFSPGGAPLKLVPVEEWSADMHKFRDFALDFASQVAHISAHVEFTRDRGWRFNAAYTKTGPISGTIVFNLGLLTNGFLTGPIHEKCRLLIHELGHHKASNHLSEEYHEAICQIGAIAISIAIARPSLFL